VQLCLRCPITNNVLMLQYLSLTVLRDDYPETPLIALTATAKSNTVEDIIRLLKMRDPVFLSQSFNRPNLFYDVRAKPRNNVALLSQIASWINSHHREQSGVIFCLARKSCEAVAEDLREKYGLKAEHYHAGMTPDAKKKTQTAWRRGKCHIMVATVSVVSGELGRFERLGILDCLWNGNRQS
jgi:superfamily II DNA helicase RecQ